MLFIFSFFDELDWMFFSEWCVCVVLLVRLLVRLLVGVLASWFASWPGSVVSYRVVSCRVVSCVVRIFLNFFILVSHPRLSENRAARKVVVESLNY